METHFGNERFEEVGICMGMESFRIDIYWKGDVGRDVVLSRLAGQFQMEPHYYYQKKFGPFSRKVYTRDYWLREYIVLHCYEPKKCLILEACLSNYEKYAQWMYDVYDFIYSNFGAKLVLGKDVQFEERIGHFDFIKHLSDVKQGKIKTFLDWYGIRDTDMRPNEYFYKNVRKQRTRKPSDGGARVEI